MGIVQMYERIRYGEKPTIRELQNIVREELHGTKNYDNERSVSLRDIQDIAEIVSPVVDSLYLTMVHGYDGSSTTTRLWLGKPEPFFHTGKIHYDWFRNNDIAVVESIEQACCPHDHVPITIGKETEQSTCGKGYIVRLK